MHADLTYADRNEPPPLEVDVTSKSFGPQQLIALGLPPDVVAQAGGPADRYSGRVRYVGTFRTVDMLPELRGASGKPFEPARPVRLEASWKLPARSAPPPARTGGMTGPLLIYVFLSVLLAAIVIAQLAMMVWLQRRGERAPWWGMLPVATSVAVWIRGGRLEAAVWWALVALYIALAVGTA